MADYTGSVLLTAQTLIKPKFNAAELRERQNPILRVGLENQDYVMDDIKSIKESSKRAVYGYQKKRIATTNGTTRSHNFTGTQGDSTQVAINWSTYSETFGHFMQAGADNVMGNAIQIANQVSQAQRNIRERLGSDLVAALHAGRTGAANATVRNATFNAATNAFEVTASPNNSLFFAYLTSVMSQHKYYGGVDVIVDSVLAPIAANAANQGSNNGTNLSWTVAGANVMPHDVLGTDVAVSAYGNGGIGIALPKNSFAFIPWIPKNYRDGFGSSIMEYNGIGTTMSDDSGLPLTYTLRGYTLRADGSSNGGTTDDLQTYWQLSVDVATQISSISAALETPVYEFAIAP